MGFGLRAWELRGLRSDSVGMIWTVHGTTMLRNVAPGARKRAGAHLVQILQQLCGLVAPLLVLLRSAPVSD